MEWSPEAEDAVKKVPFFVRKRVRARVEKEASEAGKELVSLVDVRATKARYLKNMSSEIKGFQLDTCFGPNGCPNRTEKCDHLMEELESLLTKADLLGVLKQRVKGDLKFHHEFRVAVAECPNACSQPQIKDIGIIGACIPNRTDAPCNRCEACIDACGEDAVHLDDERPVPDIDYEKCVGCGKCIAHCPTGTLGEGDRGFRVQLAGKLGRHPRLARELPGVFSTKDVTAIVRDCLDFYKKNSLHGERFSKIFTDEHFDRLSALYKKKQEA